MEIKIPYYEDNSRISNSALGWFINKGPKYLNDRLNGVASEETGSQLVRGTMIHHYILEPETFWQHYETLEFEKPKNEQQVKFCECFVASNEWTTEQKAIEAYKIAYNTDKKASVAISNASKKLYDKLKSYIKYLETSKQNKIVISWADLNMLNKLRDSVFDHKFASKLLQVDENSIAFNEFHINWVYPKEFHGIKLECKSLLDRFKIDHGNKKIQLIDLKTTADIHKFRHSIDLYDYMRQMSWYWIAIHWYLLNEMPDLNIDEYELETFIIAVDVQTSLTKVFKFQQKDIEKKIDLIQNTVSEICWHSKNNKWDNTRTYYETDGYEIYEA